MKDILNKFLKVCLYLIGFFFLGAIIIAIAQGITYVFDKYIFEQEIWKWWLSCSILGGIAYWLFVTIVNGDSAE